VTAPVSEPRKGGHSQQSDREPREQREGCLLAHGAVFISAGASLRLTLAGVSCYATVASSVAPKGPRAKCWAKWCASSRPPSGSTPSRSTAQDLNSGTVPGPVMSSPFDLSPVKASLLSRNLRVSPLTMHSTRVALFDPPVPRPMDVPTTLAPFCSKVRAKPPPPAPVTSDPKS